MAICSPPFTVDSRSPSLFVPNSPINKLGGHLWNFDGQREDSGTFPSTHNHECGHRGRVNQIQPSHTLDLAGWENFERPTRSLNQPSISTGFGSGRGTDSLNSGLQLPDRQPLRSDASWGRGYDQGFQLREWAPLKDEANSLPSRVDPMSNWSEDYSRWDGRPTFEDDDDEDEYSHEVGLLNHC
jgi:hypothetical protein